MIKNATIMEFDKQGKKVNILFDSDTPAGIVHDCLMEAKGICVDRMVQAQKQEEEISEQYKKLQVEEEGKDHGDKCC